MTKCGADWVFTALVVWLKAASFESLKRWNRDCVEAFRVLREIIEAYTVKPIYQAAKEIKETAA